MPLILQHASFELRIEGSFGVGVARVHVHRTGLDRYEADYYVPRTGRNDGYCCCDRGLERNFESWDEALKQAAKSAVGEIRDIPARVIGGWKQTNSTHFEVDEKGNRIKIKEKDGWEHDKYVHDEPLDINLPTSEGTVKPSRVLLKEGAKEGLRRFKTERKRGVYDEP